MEFGQAIALIDGRYKLASLAEALERGRCYFCNRMFKMHPKDRDGNTPLNRHHRIKLMFKRIYEKATGNAFPEDEENLFWAGVGCHFDFHRFYDPHHEKPVGQIKRSAEHLIKLFRKFMADMERWNFGQRIFKDPAPIPPWGEYRAAKLHMGGP